MAAELSPPRRRPLGFELAIVTLLALAILVPGIWSYTLVDPWETHYGEVSRRMLQDHDLVHTDWSDEGFRSKPVLTFWIEAASLTALRVATDGGYSGELVDDGARTMLAIRLPFVLFAVFGLVMMWWMLATLASRRLAWLALLVVGTSPIYCLIARQAIPDMPHAALMMGALAMFIMAMEDGDRPIVPFARIAGYAIDARHVLWLGAGGMVAGQALYYAAYFSFSPRLAGGVRFPLPNVVLPGIMLLALVAMSRTGWLIVRLPFVLLGGAIGAARGAALPPHRTPTQSPWRYVIDDVLPTWDRDAADRYLVRGLAYPIARARHGGWRDTDAIADHLVRVAPLTTMRQVFLLWCYALLGVSILAKGPVALGIVGVIGVFYVILLRRWRALYDGAFELKRGIILMLAVCLPWHVAMFLKDGLKFIDEYLFMHLLDRAGVGVDNSPGTFNYYASQLGYSMWIWAALLPAAIAWMVLRTRTDTREGRVRFVIGLWAIIAVAFFCLVQTKFHHYILPAIPALGIVVACFLDDALAGRVRLHPVLALTAIAITLFVCRDMFYQPHRWIDLFMYGYDRAWPTGEPYAIDPSDGFLALGLVGAGAIAVFATRFVRAGVVALAAAALAICLWSLHVYMPIAAPHWGMRDAYVAYYRDRTIYGETLVYFGSGELYDAWHDHGDRWRFETRVPDALPLGQPMILRVQVNRATDERQTESTQALRGTVTAIGAHDLEVTLAPGERAKLAPLMAAGANGPRGRAPIEAVDADRIIPWQLYWRGEAFWTGDEIWGWLPEMKTGGSINTKSDNVAFLKYLNDRTVAPLGRRYFVVTTAGREASLKPLLPTQRAKDTFTTIDTTSNKFTIVAFYL